MADSMPLTNRPESSVENRLASSTASSITTAVGHVGPVEQLVGGDAQHGAVDDRHPLQRPAAGVAGDQLVELGRGASPTPSTSSGGQRRRARTGRPASDLGAGDVLGVGLVQQVAAPARGRRSGVGPALVGGHGLRPG